MKASVTRVQIQALKLCFVKLSHRILRDICLYDRYTCGEIRIFRPLTKREVLTVRTDSSEVSTKRLTEGRDLLQD